MNTALWPATWGYFLGAMLADEIDPKTIEQVRTFFIRYVSGRGAIPAIRIGKQPYGSASHDSVLAAVDVRRPCG